MVMLWTPEVGSVWDYDGPREKWWGIKVTRVTSTMVEFYHARGMYWLGLEDWTRYASQAAECHREKCCRTHEVHVEPHRGCMLR